MQMLSPASVASLIAVMAGSAAMMAPPRSPAADPGARAATVARVTAVIGATPITLATTRSHSTAAAMATAPVSPRAGLTWPLSPRPAVHRRFEEPRSQWSSGHRGVDLLATVGQPVLSAGAGVVAFSGMVAGRGVVTVAHPGGLRTSYEPVDVRLASGALVHPGTGIGVVSPAPGHCVPLTCLHWGAISGQSYRDPLSLLGFGRPILLPLG